MNGKSTSIAALVALTLLTIVPAGAQTPLTPAAPPPAGTTLPATTPLPASLETPKAPTTPIAVPDDYKVDIGDMININVTRHDDVTRNLRIPADGALRLPRLVKPIQAKGKTCSELVDLITERLRDEGKLVLRPGQVSVTVMEMRVRHIYVRGSLGRNGDFDLKPGWRITELVAVMGGVPNPDRVTVRLFNPERPAPVKINLDAVLNNPNSPDNIALREGDTLTLELPHNKRLYLKGEGPKGVFELDERFGLRQALIQMGVGPTSVGGDLRRCVLLRRSIPGDPNSEQTHIPVDVFALLTDEKTADVPLQDLDTLDIPLSNRFVYVFGKTSVPKKFVLQELPNGQKTRLSDVMALGDTALTAKIDDIKISRKENGQLVQRRYKFGKFLENGDEKQNPEIMPGDFIVVPDVKRTDPVNAIWTGWGFYSILQTIIPGIRPH